MFQRCITQEGLFLFKGLLQLSSERSRHLREKHKLMTFCTRQTGEYVVRVYVTVTELKIRVFSSVVTMHLPNLPI